MYSHTQTITTFLQLTDPTNPTKSRYTEGEKDIRDRQIRHSYMREYTCTDYNYISKPTIPTNSTESRCTEGETDIKDRQIRHTYMYVYSYPDYNYISTTDSSDKFYKK